VECVRGEVSAEHVLQEEHAANRTYIIEQDACYLLLVICYFMSGAVHMFICI
jgi:hypothetical protein